MEYLDVLDENGNKTGEIKPKKEVHDKGLWHKSVHVWFVNSKGEVLLQKRSPLVDNHPNEWDISAAGHVSVEENEITSAIRETKEELGVDCRTEDFILIGIVKQMSKREGYINNEINPVYVVKRDIEPQDIKKQKEEVAEVRWIPWRELKKWAEGGADLVPHPEEYKLLFEKLENIL